VLAGLRREQQRRALEVVVVADAQERRVAGQILGADPRDRPPWSSCSEHFRRERV
jgi:hypothetical protein